MPAVVDSNAIIGLAKGRVFPILADLFGEVHIPQGVWDEVVRDGAGRPGALEVVTAQGKWLSVKRVSILMTLTVPPSLSAPDREVILLAQSIAGAVLVTDDRVVRTVCRGLGLHLAHTAEVVLAAKRLDLIPSCRDVFSSMQQAGFGIDPELLARILYVTGE